MSLNTALLATPPSHPSRHSRSSSLSSVGLVNVPAVDLSRQWQFTLMSSQKARPITPPSSRRSSLTGTKSSSPASSHPHSRSKSIGSPSATTPGASPPRATTPPHKQSLHIPRDTTRCALPPRATTPHQRHSRSKSVSTLSVYSNTAQKDEHDDDDGAKAPRYARSTASARSRSRGRSPSDPSDMKEFTDRPRSRLLHRSDPPNAKSPIITRAPAPRIRVDRERSPQACVPKLPVGDGPALRVVTTGVNGDALRISSDPDWRIEVRVLAGNMVEVVAVPAVGRSKVSTATTAPVMEKKATMEPLELPGAILCSADTDPARANDENSVSPTSIPSTMTSLSCTGGFSDIGTCSSASVEKPISITILEPESDGDAKHKLDTITLDSEIGKFTCEDHWQDVIAMKSAEESAAKQFEPLLDCHSLYSSSSEGPNKWDIYLW
ncbi:hypothetical protein BDZ91DRAFT_744330 [Kalaharituber pfeilii]|nr:hypothetical protein BDZ91DRAFT_744330 [Kalaharituber pfeilii]